MPHDKYLGFYEAKIIKVDHKKSRCDIELISNGDKFKNCVLALPLGTREDKEGYIQLCKDYRVMAFKGYGHDWLVAWENSQSIKPNKKSHNEILLQDIVDQMNQLVTFMNAQIDINDQIATSVCPPDAPLSNTAGISSGNAKIKPLPSKVNRDITNTKKRYKCN